MYRLAIAGISLVNAALTWHRSAASSPSPARRPFARRGAAA